MARARGIDGAVLSLSFVEPYKRDIPKKPNGPDLRHAPQNVGLQDLTLIFVFASLAEGQVE